VGRVFPHAGESEHRSRGQHFRQHDVTRVGVDGLCGSDHSPSDKRQRKCIGEAPGGDLAGDTGAPLPLSAARTRLGGPLGAARRPDSTTTMGRERLPWGRSRGRTTYGKLEMRSGIGIERRDLS
jgi:hypothetical protein